MVGVNSRLKDDNRHLIMSHPLFFFLTTLRLELLFPMSWPNSALCLAGVPWQAQTDTVFLCFLPLPVRVMPDVVSQLLFSSPEVVSAWGWVEPSLQMGGDKISHILTTFWDTTKAPHFGGWAALGLDGKTGAI